MALDLYTGDTPSVLPQKVDDTILKMVYELGAAMIWSDRDDIYRTIYKYRPRHKWEGKPAPHHPSPHHHYIWGGGLVLIAQMLALRNAAIEAAEVARDIDLDEFAG